MKTRPKTLQYGLRLPVGLRDAAVIASRQDMCNLPEFIRRAVAKKITRQKKGVNHE